MTIKTLLMLLITLCSQPVWSQQAEAGHTMAVTGSESAALNTRLALRDLWVEHVFWVRSYAIANQQGEGKQAGTAAAEVAANAASIANSLAPLYGQPAADQLLKLLAEHWGAVKHYSDAAVAGQAQGKNTAVEELTTNAKAIAKFLATANPNLPETTLVAMLSAHGGHHIAQIDQLGNRDYTAEARTWQAMREHMLVLADTLTAALVKQFPDKF